MGKYVTRLERIIAKVSREEPWSKSEKYTITKRDKSFIRALQVKYRCTKEDAIGKLKASRIEGPKKYKALQKDTTTYLKDLYPVHDKKIPQDSENNSARKNKKAMTQKEFKTKLLKVKPQYRKKFISAHKKYPDAEWYELSRGVNSKDSKLYRLKHHRPEQYEGRIKT